MREVQAGVWHWQAPHPDWNERQDWGRMVSSYAIDTGERLLLFDPLAPPDEALELARAGDAAIVLTCPWHRRDAHAVAEELGVPIYVPPADEGDPDPVRGEVFEAGDRLPVGVEALPGMEPNDLVLWVETRRALVFGDTLIDFGNGLAFERDWETRGAIAARGVPLAEIFARLRPLLELPVDLVLPTHGEPTGRAVLERVLA